MVYFHLQLGTAISTVKDLVLSPCLMYSAMHQSLNYLTVTMKLLTATVITVLMFGYIVNSVSIK